MSASIDIRALNIQLAEALGCSNTKHLSRVQLDIVPGQLPVVHATYMLTSPDGLATVTQQHELVPRAAAMDGSPQAEARL